MTASDSTTVGSTCAATTASIDPFGTPGRASFRLMVDADRLRIDRVVTTLPPTRGVPDGVWLDLFLESGPLRYAGSTRL